jgi:hypothetical protein
MPSIAPITIAPAAGSSSSADTCATSARRPALLRRAELQFGITLPGPDRP